MCTLVLWCLSGCWAPPLLPCLCPRTEGHSGADCDQKAGAQGCLRSANHHRDTQPSPAHLSNPAGLCPHSRLSFLCHCLSMTLPHLRVPVSALLAVWVASSWERDALLFFLLEGSSLPSPLSSEGLCPCPLTPLEDPHPCSSSECWNPPCATSDGVTV